ncbi:MAG: hypothetical protein WDA07_07455 [Leucobacter sp.]
MFSLMWRFFPGPAWLRVILLIALAAAIVYALIAYVYPWVALQMPEQEVTVDS